MRSDWPIDGLLFFLVLAAIVLAPPAAFFIRWRYRASILKLMASNTDPVRPQPQMRDDPVPAEDAPVLTVETGPPTGLAVFPRAMLVFASGYFVAGLAHAFVTAVLWLYLNGMEFLPVRVVVLWLMFAIPAVFSALYIIGLRQLFILLGAAVWVLAAMVLATPFSLQMHLVLMLPIMAALPIAIGLVLMNRKVGNIAPFLVFPVMFLALAGLLSVGGAFLGGQLFGSAWGALGGGLLSVGAGLLGGWLYLALLAKLYNRSSASELMLQHDVYWGLVSTCNVIGFLNEHGLAALLMLVPFIVYRAVVMVWGKMIHLKGEADRLLFLRVFGFQTRQSEFNRVFVNAWRRRGPVCLIGAPDVALDTIEPPELFAFVTGRLKRIFVEDPEDVKSELLKPIRCSSDGLYPIEDFYCFEDTWQASVQELIGASSLVLMDLRGFSEDNMGCLYEIGELFKRTSPEQLVFLTDASTDMPFLERALKGAWHENAQPGQRGTVKLWSIEDAKGLRRLFHHLRARVR